MIQAKMAEEGSEKRQRVCRKKSEKRYKILLAPVELRAVTSAVDNDEYVEMIAVTVFMGDFDNQFSLVNA